MIRVTCAIGYKKVQGNVRTVRPFRLSSCNETPYHGDHSMKGHSLSFSLQCHEKSQGQRSVRYKAHGTMPKPSQAESKLLALLSDAFTSRHAPEVMLRTGIGH